MHSDQKHFTLSYHKELDGLRGLAVILVLLHHCANRYMPGGYLGVDLFFVLSGFLITQILYEEFSAQGKVSYLNFYMRRALRLIPALLMLLGTFLLVSTFAGDATVLKNSLIESALTLGYIINWAIAFDLYAPHYLRHAWSLAIEEQFYLLLPVSLIFVLNSTTKNRAIKLLRTTLSLTILIWLYRIFLTESGSSAERLYNALDTHSDGLVLGCALSAAIEILYTKKGQLLANIRTACKYLSPISLLVLLYLSATLHWRDPALMYYGLTLANLCCAIAIASVFVLPAGPYHRFLSWQPLSYTGKISYGLYLWHYPLMVWFRTSSLPSSISMPLCILTSYAIATVSFFTVEKYFLSKKKKYSWRKE